MSTQVSNVPFKAYLGNEKLLREKQNDQSRIKQFKEKSRKVVTESSHSKYFTDGVRAPLLSDINFGQSCRLDVVRPAKKVQSTGSESPGSLERKAVVPQIVLEKENSNLCDSERTNNSIRSMKFLLPNGTLRSNDEPEITTRSVSDLDFRWKRSNSKASDARDVLYRNTYCNSHKKFRYHTITLPSIRTQTRSTPRIDKTKSTTKKNIPVKDTEQSQSKMQDSGIADCKNAKNLNSNNEEGFLRVQKIKSRLDYFLNGNDDLFLTVRQPTDLYNNNSSYPIELRTERPLKYETVGPHGSRLHRKHSSLQNMLPYSVRDYKSVAAYKEYLEAVKLRMEIQSEMGTRLDKDYTMSPFGRENRVLQSVIDVNTPKDCNGQSSQDNKSLVIEIKPTWNEIPNGAYDDGESEIDLPLNKCPVNTPANKD